MKHYGKKKVQPSCMLKNYLQKVYDMVNWALFHEMLTHLGFPPRFISLVMNCVTIPKLSFMLNGSIWKGISKLRKD